MGLEPLQAFFSTLSQTWSKESQQQYSGFHSLSVCAVDGIVWSMPHTKENFNRFGSSKGKTVPAPNPQMRATCLVNANTHEIIDAKLGSMDHGELTLANQLKAPPQSITLFDRAYFSGDFLINWHSQTQDSHWLMQAKDNLRYEVIKQHSKHDAHIRMSVSPRAKKLNPLLGEYWEARLIDIEHLGKTRRYITSLMDSKAYPPKEVGMLYIQRWEIEICYRKN